VFASPSRNTDNVPVLNSTQRKPLSTILSDDVFMTSPKPVLPTSVIGEANHLEELKREGPSLTHVNILHFYVSTII